MGCINTKLHDRSMKWNKIRSYYIRLPLVSNVLCVLISNKKMLRLQSCDMPPGFSRLDESCYNRVHPLVRGYIFHFNAQGGRAVRAKLKWYGEGLEWSPEAHTSRNTSYLALVTICSTANLIVNNRVHCGLRTSPTRLLSSFTWHYHNPSILACLFN